MKKSHASLLAVLTLAVSMALPQMAFADHGKGGCPTGACSMDSRGKGGGLDDTFFGKAKFFMSHKDELGLSDTQVKSIKDIKLDVKKALVRAEADIEILGMDMEGLLHQEAIDVEAVNKILDQKFEIKKAKAKNLVASLAKLKGILSKEQMDKAKDIWSGKADKKHKKD